MDTEFTLGDESRNIQVVMDASIQRENEDLRTQLRLYLENKLEPIIRDRVESILKDNGLISNGAATSDGDKLLSTGLFSAREYGQYQLTSVDNDFTDDEEVFISLFREWPSDVENTKKSGLKVQADLYDRDQKRMSHVTGTCSRIKENRPIPVDFKVVIEEEDVKCRVISKFEEKTIESDLDTKLDAQHILEKCIRNYSIPRKSIAVDDISKLDQEQKASLFANFSDSDVGDMINTTVFERPFKSFHAESIPLCASDNHVAEQWISDLRKYWWKDEFVTVKRAKFDQEYWSERLTGKKVKDLVKSDDELLVDLNGSDAYWGIASMMDLMPDSEYRMPFFISPDSDFNEEIRKNIFSEDQMVDLKKIIVVDSYPAHDSEKVIRKWTGDDSCRIIFLVNSSRYGYSSGNKLEDKDLSENAELVTDDRKKSEAHSRYLILVKKNNDMTVWNMDNSIGQFRLIKGDVETRTKMKFTPEPCIYDKELEKIVRGLK